MTTKPEDEYLLGYWNKLQRDEGSSDKSFVVRLNRDVHTVLIGLNDPDGDMALLYITPDQARAIATMLVYAAQEVEK